MEKELQRRLKEYVLTRRTLSPRHRQRRDGCWADRLLQQEGMTRANKRAAVAAREERGEGGASGDKVNVSDT